MTQLTARKVVFCPEQGKELDVDFCPGCDYYYGGSFDTIDCRYGEQIEDKIVEQIPKLNFRKLDTEDYVCLVSKRSHLLLKLRKKEAGRYDFDIPQTEIEESSFEDIFDVEIGEMIEVKLTRYAYDGGRMFLIDGSIGVISNEFDWLFDLEIDFELYAEDVYSPLYLIQDGEIFGAISPIRPSEDNFSKLREIMERVIAND